MIVLKTKDLKEFNVLNPDELYLSAIDVAIRLEKLFQSLQKPDSDPNGTVLVIEDMEDYKYLKVYQLDIAKHEPEWVRRIPLDEGDEYIISLFLLDDGSAVVVLAKLSMTHNRLLSHLN